MKKTYMKPKIQQISIMPNQSIAACGIQVIGYDNSWARGKQGYTGWKTPKEAWEAYDQHAAFEFSSEPVDNVPYVYSIIYGETEGAAGSFNDLNNNGKMDNNEYFAWQQGDYNTLVSVASGQTAAVINS